MKFEFLEVPREVYDPTETLYGNTEYLNEMGQQGWELICMTHVSTRKNVELGLFYFKREAQG